MKIAFFIFASIVALAQPSITGKTCTVQGSGGNSYSCTWTPSAPAIGDNLFFALANYQAGATFSMHDSCGNTYTANGSLYAGTGVVAGAGSGNQYQFFKSFNIGCSPTTTTVASTNGGYLTEQGFSAGGTVAVDGAVGTYSQSSGTTLTASIAPTSANDLGFCLAAVSTGTISAGTMGGVAATLFGSVTNQGPPTRGQNAIITGSGSQSATMTIGTSTGADMICSTYSGTPPALSTTTTVLPEGFNTVTYGAGSGPGTNQLQAAGGYPPYSWALTSGSLSGSGLSVPTSGLIAGTAATGSYTGLKFTVTDSMSNTATTPSITLTVAATVLSISTSTLPGATQYGTYSSSVAAAGGTTPYTYAYSSSSSYAGLPEGIVLNSSTGALAGSLVYAQGGYGVDFIATDTVGAAVNSRLNIAVTGSSTWMRSIFPSGNIFNHRMDAASTGLPVYAGAGVSLNSSPIHPSFGGNPLPQPNGIPAIQVPNNTTLQNVTMIYPGYQPPCYFGANGTSVTSCPGTNLTAPIPLTAPVEGSANCTTCDRHVFVYQESGSGNPPFLWEMWEGILSGSTWTTQGNGLWQTNTQNSVPQNGGSSNAAGTPYTELLVTPDDVSAGINHILAFTLSSSTTLNYRFWPATDQAGGGSCAGLAQDSLINQASPPASCSASRTAFGAIVRLKASIYATPPNACLTNTSTNPQSAAIFTGLYEYGMMMIDNGSTGYIIGTPDARWNDTDLTCLDNLNLLADFEPVNVSSLIVSTSSYATVGSIPNGPAVGNAIGGSIQIQ